ncbi:MAG: hypothetical protein HKN09_04340 [Saprospiraceae bacterium]|nr:hypothetical protein [Saprospiraceae bacterium]
MIRALCILFSFFSWYELVSQITFSRVIESEYGSSVGMNVEYFEDNYYLISRHACEDGNSGCGSLIQLNQNGEPRSQVYIDWIHFGIDESMIIYDSLIVISGHINTENLRSFLISGFDLDGTQHFLFEHEFPDSIFYIQNYGLLESKGSYYINGAARNAENHVLGVIQKVGKKGLSVQSTLIERKGTLEFNIVDLIEYEDRIFFGGTYKTQAFSSSRSRTINELVNDQEIIQLFKTPDIRDSASGSGICFAASNKGELFTIAASDEGIWGTLLPQSIKQIYRATNYGPILSSFRQIVMIFEE